MHGSQKREELGIVVDFGWSRRTLGSVQESGEVSILCGFLESDEFSLGRVSLAKMMRGSFRVFRGRFEAARQRAHEAERD